MKYVSKDRSDRIFAITNFLSQAQYDVVALQELWVYSDYELVRTSVSKRLPYSKFFYRCVILYCLFLTTVQTVYALSGALGAGLAIFTRFPIIAATIHPYSLNGSPIDVAGGDWFVGKAAASVLISHPILGQVQIFNTHVRLLLTSKVAGPEHGVQLFAKGGEGGPEHHRAHRLVNAWEFAKLAKQSAELGRYVIAVIVYASIHHTID